jgi:SAM-dependent methyltransferase
MKFLLRRITHPLWLHLLTRPTTPLSEVYGIDRGGSVDRYYIEGFLKTNSADIKNACLEILDSKYTKEFGHDVTRSDILDIDRENKRATIHDDLRKLDTISDNTYDCIILTQVLQFIDDYPSAIREIYRILKPGGVLLATMPAVSRADVRSGIDADFWRFTQAGANYLFSQTFGEKNVSVSSLGNNYSGLLFWIGAGLPEASRRKMDVYDPAFAVIITVRATKHA